MNEQLINEQYQYIIRLISQKRLKEALTQLESYLWKCPEWTLRNRLEQVQTSYNYMLQYMRQGVEDTDRKKLYQKLLTDAMETADQARISLLDGISTRYYHMCRTERTADIATYTTGTILQILESFNDDMAVSGLLSDQNMKEVLRRHEVTLKFMFLQTWSDSSWTAEDEIEAQAMLHSELLPVNDLCLFTSAVMLSLMECFDQRKVMWLMDAYQHPNVQVNQRALVGLTLILHIYSSRIEFYPEIISRIILLAEDKSFNREMLSIHTRLLLSQETEKIDKKMREEIIPEMLKSINPNMRNMKFGFEESDEEKDEKNPDWADAIENSPLGDKLREMNDLQMEGADVYMSTFAQLKGYPFFKEPHNWFYPFDKQHSSVINEFRNLSQDKNSILDIILDSGFFCNSDKYSLFFTMLQLPQSQREMMVSQLSEQQMQNIAERSKAETLQKFSERPETVSNQYIHDLYRFFKLYARRYEYRDIFKEKFEMELYRIPALKKVLYNPAGLETIAYFYFTKEHWAEAENIYKEIVQLMNVERQVEIYQKLGYALQKQKKYEEAIQAYLKADTIKPENLWTNRRLATCYRITRQFKKALEYYRKIEEVDPENHKLLFYTGSCLAELNEYDAAMNYFFKLDFMESNCVKAWRAIGWCSFVCGKPEQAMKYYIKVLDTKPHTVDYLNAGHVAWALGDIENTIKLYTQVVEQYGSREQFLEMFNKDKEEIIAQGVSEDDIPLVLDLI